MAEGSFWFGLEVGGVVVAAFSSLTISSEVDPGPPVRRIQPMVTIGRRQNDDGKLFAWHQSVLEGPIEAARKDCTVTVFDAAGAQVARYALEKAWPFKLAIGPVGAGADQDLIESATLRCDSVRRVA